MERIHKVKPKVRTEAEVFAQSGGKDAALSKHEEGGKTRFDGFVVPPSPLVSPYALREASFTVRWD